MRAELIAGRYRVMRAVGRGGMGVVWLCRDEVLHREVAVKQIEGLQEESAAKAARPLREARLAAALNHENAVSMYDIVEHDGSTWLVMEYVHSQTLAELMRQEDRLAVDRVVRIGAQLASALATAHSLGIIHRDIKPGNVLVGEDDLAKISDFGIARGHHDEQLTLTGLVTGTPAYFSPELARGGDPSQASDVWALGATLYAAVEGGPPYGKDPNPLALLVRIASQPPPRPAHAGRLTSTLATMLNPRAEARASMEAVAAALHRLAEPEDVHAARIREKSRAYSETTLHDRGLGLLHEMMGPSRSPAPDELSTVIRPAAERTPRAALPPDEPPREGRRGRPSLTQVTVGVAALLVLLVAGTVAWSTIRSPARDDTSAPPAGGHPQTSGTNGVSQPSTTKPTKPTPPTTPSQSTTLVPPTSPPSTAPPSTASPPTSAPPPPPPASPGAAAFVTSYFQLVPDDLNSGWKQLSPSMRSIGRDSYDSFWGAIDSIDVANVQAVSAGAVEYDITYHFTGGRVVLERKRIDLAPHGQSYWITDDTVLTSTTLNP